MHSISMPQPWWAAITVRPSWLWIWGLQILFKEGSIVYRRMNLLTLSFELHVQGWWQSEITPVWCWFHSFTRCVASVGPVQMPMGLLREEPGRQLVSGPGSTEGISTCSSPGSCRCCLVFPDAAVMCLVYSELSASEPGYFLRDINSTNCK